jgi:16S rRNA (cytosine1402-N4)-methyltransferase
MRSNLPITALEATRESGSLLRFSAPFMDKHQRSLGTEPRVLFETMVHAAFRWVSAWPSQILPPKQKQSLGTVLAFADQTDVRTAPGWLSVRRLLVWMEERLEFLGAFLHSRLGVKTARTLGAIESRPTFNQADGCAAPADFSEMTATAGVYHLPVFPAETAEWMAAAPGKFIIDGTLGGGGHSELFLKTGARVLGVDRDPEALAHARNRLVKFGDQFSTWEGNFSQIQKIPAIQSGELADGLLMDLGVSSRQLDSAARGFSFMREGPLDMRMGPSSPRTAADVVNRWSEGELVRILFEYGEESKARRIAGAIIKQRAIKPFETTLDLANCIERAIGRHGRTHPATKTFQAIRMAVNEELESLAQALAAVPSVLKPGGRLLIITFHSLEDRMVKRFLKHRSTAFLDEAGWPEPRKNPDYQFRLLARKSIAPSAEEISMNPRARSAKLRVAQLLDIQP